MKSALSLLLLALCAGAGCLSLPFKFREEPKPAPAVAAKPAQSRPPVTPDEVSDGNARETAGALLRELDTDGQPAPAQQTVTPCKH
jgi:hypothetical protein